MLRAHIYRVDLRPVPFRSIAPAGSFPQADLPFEAQKGSETITSSPRYLVLSDSTTTIPVGRTSKSANRERLSREDNAYFDSAVISRRHAQFVLEDGHVYLMDCGSMHGTTVDGVRLREGRKEIKAGSEVIFGSPVFRDSEGPKMHYPLAFKCEVRKEEAEGAKVIEQAATATNQVDTAGKIEAMANDGPKGYGLSTADVAVSDAEYGFDEDDDVLITSVSRKEKKVETITIDADVDADTTLEAPIKKAEPVAESTPVKAASHVVEEQSIEISDNEDNVSVDASLGYDEEEFTPEAIEETPVVEEEHYDSEDDEDYSEDEDNESHVSGSEHSDDEVEDEDVYDNEQPYDYMDDSEDEEIYAGDDEVMQDHAPVALNAFPQANVCQTTSDFPTDATMQDHVEPSPYDALDFLDYFPMADHRPRTHTTLPEQPKSTPAIGTFHTYAPPAPTSTATPTRAAERNHQWVQEQFDRMPKFVQLPHFRSVPQHKTEKPAGEHRVSIANLLGDMIQNRNERSDFKFGDVSMDKHMAEQQARMATATPVKAFENSIKSLLSPTPAHTPLKLSPASKRKFEDYQEDESTLISEEAEPVEPAKKDIEMSDAAIQTTDNAVKMVDAQTEAITTSTAESSTETLSTEQEPIFIHETKHVIDNLHEPSTKKVKRSYTDGKEGGFAKFATGALAGIVLGGVGMFAALVATAPAV